LVPPELHLVHVFYLCELFVLAQRLLGDAVVLSLVFAELLLLYTLPLGPVRRRLLDEKSFLALCKSFFQNET